MNYLARALRLGAGVLALGAASAHAEPHYTFASGADYSSGDYGQATDTEVVSIPLIVRMTNNNWSVRASTSYLQVTGPADVADLDGGGDTSGSGGGGGTTARTGTERGLGDTNLALGYTFRRLGGSHAYFETTARVRLPTGDDDKGLGVGTTDYGLSAELGVSQRGGGAALELTRRFLGDRAGVERQDGWQVSASSWLRTGERSQLGVFGSWREASIDGNEEPSQLGAYASYQMTPSVRLTLNAAGGLSDANADYTTGVRLTWRPASN